ncbi:MerR family transcriptional regulator [Alkalibacillus haloalkaliphilus]|uniref:MerR family transcriptional regulator n=1 Tax=Alkalibacillus haloalkaliphilus TaxID=94136 RepID=UPI0029367CD1|nr:MerR family transcriptional regulator [Alkalibacillus haloalkaliphilus]MDV2582990.1 MerR family transcriptional regulator [Alkalibacillus haloalkaliphilus]
MKDRFTIGEIAKLHNISVKTLRYYDEIDLFKPIEVDQNNNYRYYSTDQFEHLNTINYLRNLGVSLKDIKEQFDKRDLNFFLDILKKQQQETENKIHELQNINERVQNRISELEWAKSNQNIGKPFIKPISERKIIQIQKPINSHSELEISLRRLENIAKLKSSIFIGSVGVTLPINQLQSEERKKYNSVFLLVEEENVADNIATTLPAGQYVCMYCNDERINSKQYYAQVMEYIKENQLTINGDAIERTIIDHYITYKPEEFLSEIQIPII